MSDTKTQQERDLLPLGTVPCRTHRMLTSPLDLVWIAQQPPPEKSEREGDEDQDAAEE